MKSDKAVATYRRLRDQPLWKLLAADSGSTILGLLHTHLYDAERSLPASILHERVGRDLEDLRARGEHWPQTAQAYIADWLAAGYVERHYPPGVAEEQYELSTAAASAVRFVSTLEDRRATATESRLATVLQQLVGLAADTEPSPESRTVALRAERDRIDRQIEALQRGHLTTLAAPRAVERARDIIALSDELIADFHRVRDEFEHLNRNLRERLLDTEANRGEVLEALFAGVDLIADSDAGRTFAAFWRLLTDPQQSASLEQAVHDVLTREFAALLDLPERRFLLRLTRSLLTQGGKVHEVLQTFARSLKHFVQSREYLEQRRLAQLLREAQSAALTLKEHIKAAEPLDYILQLSTSRLRSVSQWVLHDPALQIVDGDMTAGQSASIDLETIGTLVAESEIDFRTLKVHITHVLQERASASIAEILDQFPAEQGLGTIVGYIALGSRHGVRAEATEHIEWRGTDDLHRSARIPVIYFLKERAHELTP